MVTKLDRLARSLPDALGVVDDLTDRDVKLSIGDSLHDPMDPVAGRSTGCRASGRHIAVTEHRRFSAESQSS